MSVALFYHPDNVLHSFEWPHIEKCTRASDVYAHLDTCGLLPSLDLHEGRAATDEELLTVHTQAHVDEVHRMTKAARDEPTNRALREPDGPGGIYYSEHADYTARLACGAAIDAALHVLRSGKREGAGEVEGEGSKARRCAFALVRPPGHHAGYDETPDHRAEGFCFFNSVAVAARCALQSGEARRVCILDWDVHHGNGTQRMLYEDANVLYISLHRFGNGWYPLTGAAEEVGSGEGSGMTLNVPWPADGLGYSDYAAAFRLIILPVLNAFDPDLLLISAGFDASDGDIQGKMRLTPDGFAALTSTVLASVSCPVAAALEGGYNSPLTCACCEAMLRAMAGERRPEPRATRLAKCTEPTIRAVVAVQQAHWAALRGQEAALDAFFSEARRCAEPERVSKRARVGSGVTMS